MGVLKIITYPDPVLRQVCQEVTDITPEIKKLALDMADTMYHAEGIGLAAVQVGSLHRLIVVDVREDNKKPDLYHFVNPVLTQTSGSTEDEEGCLSIPGVRDMVRRYEKVEVKALDLQGKELIIPAEGLLAICLQHEIDHLNGILFIDHLSKLKRELIRAKYKKSKTS